MKAGVSVTTEVVSGYDFSVLGALQRQAADGTGMKSYPIAAFIEFGPDELINNLSITAIDLYPLLEPIKSAAKTGALEPTATAAEPAKKVA